MNPQLFKKNKRILIVDDTRAIHEDFRKILCERNKGKHLELLEEDLFGRGPAGRQSVEGFELDSAYQGEEAFDKVKQANAEGRPYAMAFMDVNMPPGCDGIETTARIWSIDPDIQIVICTAYSVYSWEEISARLYLSDRLVIVKKPFDGIEVLQLATALTEKWALGQQAKRHLQELSTLVEERTRALRIAKESAEMKESHLRLVFDAVPIGLSLSVVGQEEKAMINQAHSRITRIQDNDAVDSLGVLAPIHADDHARQVEMKRRLISGEINEFTLENRYLKPDGKIIWGVLTVRRLTDPNTGQVNEITTIVDITEHKRLEEQFRQAQKMEAFGQLAGGVAHDFNNILTVIQGSVSMLRSGVLSEKDQSAALEETYRAAERASNLTRQLLTFSRRQPLQQKEMDLNDAVANMTKMLRRLIGEHIMLETQYAPTGARVLADPGMMEQLLMNLAVNSRDAMPRGGRLLLRTQIQVISEQEAKSRKKSRAGEFICLTVGDDGMGIPPENLAHIFEPFFTTKEPGKGTGLGLATVFGIVDQHGGWVEVQTSVGVGTTFHVFLPRCMKPAAPRVVTSGNRSMPGGTETILLAEDDSVVRGFMQTLLIRSGYRVYAAASGVEALKIWHDHKPQINMLVTDMVMPGGLGGRELGERVRAEKPELKVLHCSGYTDEMLGADSPLRNSLNFLEKPFDLHVFLQRVRACLDTNGAEIAMARPPHD